MSQLKYFGTSGIRGRTLIDITPAFAEKMARAFSNIVLLPKSDHPKVVIGRDPRYGSELIELSVMVGLLSCGVSVTRCNIVPTPVLSTYLKHTRSDGAVMITGSHIPPDRIGLIFIQEDGSYCSDNVAFAIEEEFQRYRTYTSGIIPVSSLSDLERIGSVRIASEVYDIYEQSLRKLIDFELLKSKKFKIVVDPGNGTASHYFSSLLKDKLGYEVICINDEFAGKSERLSEPIKENLSTLLSKVTQDIDLGIAFDVDADRATFVISTDRGPRVINANETGGLLIKYLLESGTKGNIVLPINSSNLAEKIMADYGLNPIYCKIGQPGTIEKVKEVGECIFSYEESGKFYLLQEDLLWTDGILVALKILEVIIKKKKSLQVLVDDLPKFYSLVDKVQIPDEQFNEVKIKIETEMKSTRFSNEKERVDIDGFRINFDDNSWLLVRPSGTEPKIRIMANSMELNRCKELISLGKSFVENLLVKTED